MLEVTKVCIPVPTGCLVAYHDVCSLPGRREFPLHSYKPLNSGRACRADKIGQWGDITLLFQEKNGQPGLQVYLPTEDAKKQTGIQLVVGDVDLESGTWISAPIIPNTVLVGARPGASG